MIRGHEKLTVRRAPGKGSGCDPNGPHACRIQVPREVDTVVPLAMPPPNTNSLPVLLTVVEITIPPEKTPSVPPPFTTVTLAVPPDETNRKSPLLTESRHY
jgi:hypothetical protein